MTTVSHLQDLVASLCRKRAAVDAPEPESSASRWTEPWTGPADVDCGGVVFKIAFARSSLEARETLVGAERDQVRLLLLTTVAERDLGHDVLARLVKPRLESLSPVDALREHYRVKDIDPRIRASVGLMTELLQYPPEPCLPPFLDLESAWGKVLAQRFRVP